MSNTLRIALVAEGVTDYEVLRAAVESMLNGQSFDIKLLQPEGSVAFTGAGNAGPRGGVAGREYTGGVCRRRNEEVAPWPMIRCLFRTTSLCSISMPTSQGKTPQMTH